MKNIKLTFSLFFVTLSALWLLADNVLTADYGFFALRNALVNYSGIIAMGAMSTCMILALRSTRIEAFLDGLDKVYRLHKWLGVAALVFSIIHWLWVKVPKWMVGWGWLVRPAKKPAAEQTVAIFNFFQSQRRLAEDIGEWALYAAVILIVLALLKRFPYRLFFKTHRLLAIVYLFLVYHSLVLMKFTYWGSVIGPLMAVLLLSGSIAAFVVLFRKVGSRRQVVGEIEALEHHQDNRVLRVSLMLKGPWTGHQAGQFAFVTFDKSEGPHPFTISSAWRGDGKLDFHIKGIGDYTQTLPDTLKKGDLVDVEGPYGCFDFNSTKPAQIWVAGGIGITPFIARMRALAQAGNEKNIDLFYCTKAPDEGFINYVRCLSEQAKVHLHLLVTTKDGYLDAERICQQVPQWRGADVWFCGPAGFGQSLRSALVTKGLSADCFHNELFDMR